jgi:P-type Ca2+ transporter type 2C
MPEWLTGLASADVPARRREHGANVLTPPPRTPGWKLYLEKFNDPVIRILMIAAGIAIAVGAVDGHMAEGIGILMAIGLATFLAYWNESRAAREFDVLNTTRDDVPVKVIRDGAYGVVPKRDVVVDDLVFVEVGEEVPADGTLVEAVGLMIDESRLTGEAIPAEKSVPAKLLRGTTVVDGYARLQITAVGDRTEMGRTLVDSIAETGDESPLHRQLAGLSKIIGIAGFGIALIAFVALLLRGHTVGTLGLSAGEGLFFGLLTVAAAVGLVNIWLPVVCDAIELLTGRDIEPSWIGGSSWLISLAAAALIFVAGLGIAIAAGALPQNPSEWIDRADARVILRDFMIAVTIIVVAVPEGLAMSVTLSLAYSMRKMTAQNTLVRRMDATETIGAATVICSDKTGTLTMNQMRLFEAQFDGPPSPTLPTDLALRARIIEAIAANSTAHLTIRDGKAEAIGNPTEGALLLWLFDHGIDYQAARSAFAVQTHWNFNTDRKIMATRGDVLHVKGAPEIVLDRCTLTAADRDAILKQLADYQSRGMRTLAFAYHPAPSAGDLDAITTGLTWLGLVAIADPVRPDVPGAVAACRKAGVAIKIVTGDTAATANEIARQIGLEPGTALTGPEFASLADADVPLDSLCILARARPADKLRLVRLLKERGDVVAVTGDGVNDGPALNHANVGLAMGKTGTAVAREASDIILLDDSFPSIITAVKWGRALYENIQRFILFQLTINVVALGLAVLGPFIGWELPLTVMQMLWVNLIMDTFAALALATEPPHESVLTRPPRSPQTFIVTRSMAVSIFTVGGIFLAIMIALIVDFRDALGDDPSRSGTIIFTVFVLLQFWNLFNAKAFGRSGSVLPSLANNLSFVAIAAAILVGQVLLVQFGGEVFRTVPLSILDWVVMLAATSIVLIVGEARRAVARDMPNDAS